MKKKIIGFVGVALFACGLYINQAQGASLQDEYNEAVGIACDTAKDLAYDVMILRQIPITESEQIQFIKEIGLQKRAEDQTIRIIKDAHTRPIYDSKMVNIVATDFSYEIMDKCLYEMTGTIL